MPLYKGTVFSSLAGAGTRNNFANTFEFNTDVALDSPEMATWMNHLATFISTCQLNTMRVNRVVVSTMARETGAAAVNNFRSLSVNQPGANSPAEMTTGMYDVNHCLIVARSATLGRAGAVLIRGCLLESDVQINGTGEADLSDSGVSRLEAFNSSLGNNMTLTGFTPMMVKEVYTGTGANRVFTGQLISTPITEYKIAGVRLSKMNHKFFNRKPAGT